MAFKRSQTSDEPGASWDELAGLLRLLREHADVVEADLQRFYQVDYRDRWRKDEHGRPLLTVRRLYVLLLHLPSTSALADLQRNGKPDWSLEAHLLDDIRMTLQHTDKKRPPQPHPARPRGRATPRKDTPQRRAKIADARRRAQARRDRFAREAVDG